MRAALPSSRPCTAAPLEPSPRRELASFEARLQRGYLWRDLIANGRTLAEAAAEWDLPVEAIDEAVRWCEANRALVALEAQEERLRIEAAGGKPAAAR